MASWTCPGTGPVTPVAAPVLSDWPPLGMAAPPWPWAARPRRKVQLRSVRPWPPVLPPGWRPGSAGQAGQELHTPPSAAATGWPARRAGDTTPRTGPAGGGGRE